MTYAAKPRIVIVGAGFGGLAVAGRLARVPAAITLIDRQNHHLFQPLLYQVATAGLSPADIAWDNSSRNASTGAMRAARRAGTNAAANATSASSTGIAT